MPIGKYKVPRELQDEDRWFKWWTKSQLAIFIVAGIIDFGVISLFAALHIVVVGIVLAILILIFAAAIVYIKMPRSRHTHGGGMGFDTLFMRIIRRKSSKNRVIYTGCIEYEEPDKISGDKRLLDKVRERI